MTLLMPLEVLFVRQLFPADGADETLAFVYGLDVRLHNICPRCSKGTLFCGFTKVRHNAVPFFPTEVSVLYTATTARNRLYLFCVLVISDWPDITASLPAC